MNFVEKILANGYVRIVHEWAKNQIFNTNNGWMGLTIYHPNERFEKNNSVVELSLERYGTKDDVFENGKWTSKLVNEKKIKITIGGEVVYENDYGVLPPLEIEQKLY